MENDALYKENILELYRNPLNKRALADFDMERRELNTVCGDEITVRVKLAGDRVVDVGHQGDGCAISQAAASVVTEEIKGKTVEEISHLGKDDVFALLGTEIIPTRIQCALLGLKAIQNALHEKK